MLFGKLKNGGHVRVVVKKQEADAVGEEKSEDKAAQDKPDRDKPGEDGLGFEFLDGPVTPKPEKIPPVRRKGKRRGSGGSGGPRRAKPPGPRGDGGAPPASRGSVPKIPLVKV